MIDTQYREVKRIKHSDHVIFVWVWYVMLWVMMNSKSVRGQMTCAVWRIVVESK